MLIDTLQKYLETLSKSKNVNKTDNFSDFQTERFFESLNVGKYTKDQIKLIEVFCKKIEVSKKLYTYYDAKTFKPHGDKQISQDSFCRIICHLIGIYLYTKDYKFLNTILKISSDKINVTYYHLPLSLSIMCESLLDDV